MIGPGETPYAGLSPDVVIAAVEAAGHRSDGRVLALNSYENRVYQVGREDAPPVVAKFYRPGRWRSEAILEEHAFACELAAAEIPVVAPHGCGAATLLEHAGYRYALYDRRGGRWPDLDTKDDRVLMGRFLGRLHRVGGVARFAHRPALGVDWMARQPAREILDGDWLPSYLVDRYRQVVDALVEGVEAAWAAVGPAAGLRLHGDCHRGNVLWTEAGPHFVDLDDCLSGPAIQDLWMLLSGNREDMRSQLADLVEGYGTFRELDPGEVALIEPLRALRMIHYAGWLARRWGDPAFPQAFPWFGSPRYWEEHVRQLMEQLEALEAPPLRL